MEKTISNERFQCKLIDLSNTEFDYSKTSISAREGEFIWKSIRENRYAKTLEIGCALGISSLYICDASSNQVKPEHTIIDPF